MKQTVFHGSSKGSPCFLTGKAHLEKQQSGRFWHGCHCKRSPSSLGLWESFMEVFLDVFEAVFDSQCGTFPIGKLAGCLLNILMFHHEFPDKYHPKVSGGFSMATC